MRFEGARGQVLLSDPQLKERAQQFTQIWEELDGGNGWQWQKTLAERSMSSGLVRIRRTVNQHFSGFSIEEIDSRIVFNAEIAAHRTRSILEYSFGAVTDVQSESIEVGGIEAFTVLSGLVALEASGALNLGNHRFLALQCGTGIVCQVAQRLGFQAVGFDTSPYKLALAEWNSKLLIGEGFFGHGSVEIPAYMIYPGFDLNRTKVILGGSDVWFADLQRYECTDLLKNFAQEAGEKAVLVPYRAQVFDWDINLPVLRKYGLRPFSFEELGITYNGVQDPIYDGWRYSSSNMGSTWAYICRNTK